MVAPPKILFRVHAIRRMFERQISVDDVHHVLRSGETIERYPEDKPYPSRLVLGHVGSRPVHAVVADNSEDGETIIVTAYEPSRDHWEPDFKGRKK